MTKTTFKKKIQNLTQDQLVSLLLDLFTTSKLFRDIISSRLSESDADDVLEKYVSRLEKSFNKLHSFSLSSCKSILADCESIAPDEKHKAVINYWFAYYAAEFSRTYGDIDSPFYNALVKAGLRTIEYSGIDRDFYELWHDRIEDLINSCGYFGWGVEEDLKRAFTDVELKWFDEDESADEGLNDSDETGSAAPVEAGEERDGS